MRFFLQTYVPHLPTTTAGHGRVASRSPLLEERQRKWRLVCCGTKLSQASWSVTLASQPAFVVLNSTFAGVSAVRTNAFGGSHVNFFYVHPVFNHECIFYKYSECYV